MNSIDVLKNIIETKGWMAISTLFFDNTYNLQVATKRGYVGYSESTASIIALCPADTGYSDEVSCKFVAYNGDIYGHLGVISFFDEEMLQHFDVATYTPLVYYNESRDRHGAVPSPKYPDQNNLEGNTLWTVLDNTEKECIRLYDGRDMPSARVDTWEDWYKNHELFKEYVAEAFGITDLI